MLYRIWFRNSLLFDDHFFKWNPPISNRFESSFLFLILLWLYLLRLVRHQHKNHFPVLLMENCTVRLTLVVLTCVWLSKVLRLYHMWLFLIDMFLWIGRQEISIIFSDIFGHLDVFLFVDTFFQCPHRRLCCGLSILALCQTILVVIWDQCASMNLNYNY